MSKQNSTPVKQERIDPMNALKHNFESEFGNISESEFDELLETCMPELPPSDIVADVTPWRKATKRIFTGMVMNAITLRFFGLNYILPTAGLLLCLLGFRTLHQENKWFHRCWIITIMKAAYRFPLLALDATIYQGEAYASTFMDVLSIVNLVLQFSLVYCLSKAFQTVQEKAGLPPRTNGATALLVWYTLLCVLAVIQYSGFIISFLMVIAYIVIIRSLSKLSKSLDEAGYTIQTAPLKISDRDVVIAVLATLTVGIACGYLFFHSYPMHWKPMETSSDTDIAEIKEHLKGIGFPEDILNDLSEEDIKACEGAVRLVVSVEDHPVNDGRVVMETIGNTTYRDIVYDVKELRITSIGVELPGEREQWKIFHHFQWTVNPGFHGTESLMLQPTAGVADCWSYNNDVTGRVLYDMDGQTYVAPYYSLGNETYTSNSILFGEGTATDVYAAFSMPNKGENHRGYVCFTLKELKDGCIINAWIDYTHQRTWIQYPVQTAKENRMINNWFYDGAFKTVDEALQFYPHYEVLEAY